MPSSTPIATDAFPRLLELMGVDPKHFDLSAAETQDRQYWTMGGLHRASQANHIFNAFALDDDELTAQLLLSGTLAGVEEETSFTLASILKDPSELNRFRTLSSEIRAILNSDRAVENRVGFAEVLEGALEHYGVKDLAGVREVIEDDYALGELRLNALNAVHNLRTTQFLQGDAGDPIRPQYNTVVRRWWNLDHMLAAHTAIPEGVSLNVVATGKDYDMFFCYAVRRGANLYLIHDAPEWTHPLESQRRRRPDRDMANRINAFYFPYDLVDVSLEKGGREAHIRSELAGKRVTALEILGNQQEFSRVIGTIADLKPVEMIWNAMMFDLLMDKFWSPAPLPALPVSYTATQLKSESQLLLETAQAAGLPVAFNESAIVAVPDLTVGQVASLHEQPDADQALGSSAKTPLYDWMKERYGHLVTDDVVNPLADGKHLPRLSQEGRFELVPTDEREPFHSMLERHKAPVKLEALAQDAFGTAEQLKADRAFLARHNYAKSLAKFAILEHAQERERLKEWVANAYGERKEFLLSLVAAAHGNALRVKDWDEGNAEMEGVDLQPLLGNHYSSSTRAGKTSYDRSDANVIHTLGVVSSVDDERYENRLGSKYLSTGMEHRSGGWKPHCLVTGAAASYYAVFQPSNSLELAWFLGKDIEELPVLLRNYNRMDIALGNSILNRIDPMAATLESPWAKEVFGVYFGLSKRGLAQLLKEHSPNVDLSSLDYGNAKFYTGKLRFPLEPWAGPDSMPSPSTPRRGPKMK